MPDQFVTPECPRELSRGHARPPESIVPAIDALQTVLHRIMTENHDLDFQARYVPRVATAMNQAIRTHHQMGGGTGTDVLAVIAEVDARLDAATGLDMPE